VTAISRPKFRGSLCLVIGYDEASVIAHTANDEDLTLKEAPIESRCIDKKRFDELGQPGHGLPRLCQNLMDLTGAAPAMGHESGGLELTTASL